MKPPVFKDSPVIVKELFCRVGQDWQSKSLFIGSLKSLDSEIAYVAAKELKISNDDLHRLTCVFKDNRKSKITGDSYLASKLLKLKVRVTVEECELIDDIPTESE